MPLGYESLRAPAPPSVPASAAAPALADGTASRANTVRIYGSSDDLIEIEGDVPGCDEYNGDNESFMLIGESRQVRVRLSFLDSGLWAIACSQAAEGMDVLPVRIEGGETGGAHPGYSPVAVIDAVRLVIHER